MSLYLGNNLVSGVATPTEPTRNLGQIIESIVPLTDAGLHLLDGALINGSGIYSAFVDAIADLVTDYPDLFETEANWQSAVTTYGVCGKFVYDSVNNTVRLPKITGILEGTTDVTALGELVEAGLPNITGEVNVTHESGLNTTGAFSSKYTSNYGYTARQSSGYGFTFNASRSNAIYGNSSTVQPQTIKCYYYIVIATSTKTEIEVDIDQIATDLNGKADVDLTNLSVGLTNTICTTTPTTISSASSARPAVVVENYRNGSSWYRIWSDKFCEQGGQSSNVASGGNLNVDLLKAFVDTNYTLLSTSNSAYYAAAEANNTATKVSASRINLSNGSHIASVFTWEAKGFIA